ncbi:MAG: RluA family pseudouridine synthase [Deltaproteobacteria bacterium]|nr:RluA family pseudouridine synthase [Deltaproteobacteria bacterium]
MRWVVRSGDGATVGDIVRRAGQPAQAIAEGRVFLGRKRVKSASERVATGDEVTIHGPRSEARGAGPMRDEVVIVRNERELVAAIKPSGMPTVPDHAGSAHAFVALVAAAIGRSVDELRVTSRLDREVSGAVVFATSAEAEAELKEARARGLYERTYVAIATNAAALPAEGTWSGAIGDGKDPRHRSVGGKNAKESETRFRVVARAGAFALLAVSPITGRTHQIRVHSAHAGAPLLGDRDYGGAARVTLDDGAIVALSRIALHAARVRVTLASGVFVAEAPIPAELTRAWAALGGAEEAWGRVHDGPGG